MSGISGQQIQDNRRDFLTNNRVGRVIVCSRYIPLLQRLREHPPDLLTMVEQITNCLHALFHDAHILHHDVSVSNILWQPSQSPETEGKFVLCDLDSDLAVAIEGGPSAPANTRVAAATAPRGTGTLPFLAIELLENAKTLHRLYHDYESLFWVTLWCAMNADYRTGTERAAVDEFIKNWELVDMEKTASHKTNALRINWKEFPLSRSFRDPDSDNFKLLRGFRKLIWCAPAAAEDMEYAQGLEHSEGMDSVVCKEAIMDVVKAARSV